MPGSFSESVRIETAGEDHVETISRLAREIWRECYADLLSPEQIEYMLERMYSLETLREEIRSLGIRYDLLRIGDEFGGFASYGPIETESVGAFKLHKLYLDPRWHGRGFGSALLHHCERAARERGAAKLILNVNKRNAKAIRAYERNGYTMLRSETKDIGGGFEMDDYVMGKELYRLKVEG